MVISNKHLYLLFTIVIAICIPTYGMEHPEVSTRIRANGAHIRPRGLTSDKPEQTVAKKSQPIRHLISGPDAKQERGYYTPIAKIPNYLEALSDSDKDAAAKISGNRSTWIRNLQKIWGKRLNNKDLLSQLTTLEPDIQKQLTALQNNNFPLIDIVVQNVFASQTFTSCTIANGLSTGAIVVDNDTAYIGCTDGSLMQYDFKTQKTTVVKNYLSAITCMAINKEVIALGLQNGTIYVINKSTLETYDNYTINHSAPIIAITLSNPRDKSGLDKLKLPDNARLWKLGFLSTKGRIYVWDYNYQSNRPHRQIYDVNDAELLFKPNGALICAPCDDPNIYICDYDGSPNDIDLFIRSSYLSPNSLTVIDSEKMHISNESFYWPLVLTLSPHNAKKIIQALKRNTYTNYAYFLLDHFYAYLTAFSYPDNLLSVTALGAITTYFALRNSTQLNLSDKLPVHIIDYDFLEIPMFVLNGMFQQQLIMCNARAEVTFQQDMYNVKKAHIMDGKLVLVKKDNSFKIMDLNVPFVHKIKDFFQKQLLFVEWELVHKLNKACVNQTKIRLTKQEVCVYEQLILKLEKHFDRCIASTIDVEFKKHMVDTWQRNVACTIV